MRIAHVTDCYLPRLGGIEMQVHDLAARQREAGHDVQVITTTAADPAADPPWVRRLGSGAVAPAARGLLRALARPGSLLAADVDVVHAHLSVVSPLASAAARAATRRGVPTAVTVHSMLSGVGPIARLVDRSIGVHEWPLAWSAVSDVAAAPLRAALGEGIPVSVLANGIDPACWRIEPAPRDPGEVVVVSVMRLAARKRPLPLLRILRQVRQRLVPDIRLRAVLIGDGPERPAMQRYLHRHGMAGWVELPGRLDRSQIREIYTRADVYVAPAHLESFGIAALEARCAGLPVVAARASGVSEFIEHGRDGLLAGSDAEMVTELGALAGSPAYRARIAAHNRAVVPPLAWPEVLARTELLYERAARRAGVTWTRPPAGRPARDRVRTGA